VEDELIKPLLSSIQKLNTSLSDIPRQLATHKVAIVAAAGHVVNTCNMGAEALEAWLPAAEELIELVQYLGKDTALTGKLRELQLASKLEAAMAAWAELDGSSVLEKASKDKGYPVLKAWRSAHLSASEKLEGLEHPGASPILAEKVGISKQKLSVLGESLCQNVSTATAKHSETAARHLKAAGWPMCDEDAALDWESFLDKASASWFSYEGSDELFATSAELEKALTECKVIHEILGRDLTKATKYMESEETKGQVDVLVYSVRLLKTLGDESMTQVKIQRWAKRTKEFLLKAENARTKQGLPTAVLEKIEALAKGGVL